MMMRREQKKAVNRRPKDEGLINLKTEKMEKKNRKRTMQRRMRM